MYIHQVGKFEVIFDSKEDYDLVTEVDIGRKKGKRKIYVDNSSSKPYAKISLFGKDVKIHHLLKGRPLNKKMIDHFNGNSLDNRRGNLRVVSRSENGYNKPTKTKLFRGINKQKNGKYKVTFRLGLGSYYTLEEAKQVMLNYLKEKNIVIHEDFL